jgi:hypothetical protein
VTLPLRCCILALTRTCGANDKIFFLWKGKGKGNDMNGDNKHKGRRRKPVPAGRRATVNTTVDRFAKRVVDWLVEWADEDDVRQFVAEFEGVPVRNVTVVGDDIKIATR